MGRHHRSRSHSRSRSSSRHYRTSHKRDSSHHVSREEHLTKDQWKELKQQSKFGHSNRENRFGDDDLDSPFIWKAKEGNQTSSITEKQLVLKRLEKREEILNVQARRQREEELLSNRKKAKEEQEMIEEQKEADLNMQKEKEFHLTQKLIGMRIRIQSGREKPIDRMLKNILLLDEINKPMTPFDTTVLASDTPAEVETVEEIVQSLYVDECNELLEDLDEAMQLPEMEPFLTYLAAVRAVIVEHLGGNDVDDKAMHASVIDDVRNLIEGKSVDEIKELQSEITSQLETEEGMDVDYWNAVLTLLRLATFKEVLREEQARFMKGRDIEKQKRLEEERRRLAAIPTRRVYTESDALEREFSPDVLPRSALAAEIPIKIVNPEDDLLQLQQEREMVKHRELEALTCKLLEKKHIPTTSSHFSANVFENEVEYQPMMEELAEGEEVMKGDVQLPHQIYSWQHKYIPKKPIFYNKVKKGYDWNQYNQTHYDAKNPPPKVIQGYSFNIFYPELADKSQRPSFSLETDQQDSDYCIIRFHAGAPYEDVAFRIVNRVWDRGKKSRFKNVFERGVLHLHFDFKKYIYKFS